MDDLREMFPARTPINADAFIPDDAPERVKRLPWAIAHCILAEHLSVDVARSVLLIAWEMIMVRGTLGLRTGKDKKTDAVQERPSSVGNQESSNGPE